MKIILVWAPVLAATLAVPVGAAAASADSAIAATASVTTTTPTPTTKPAVVPAPAVTSTPTSALTPTPTPTTSKPTSSPTSTPTPTPATSHAARSDLDVGITHGSESVVAGASVTFSGTYSCNDDWGAHSVTVAAVLDQGNDDGGFSASVNVPCQVSNGPWTMVVPFPGVKAGTEVDAQVTTTDYDVQATSQARLVAHTAFITVNPVGLLNSDGSVTISGTYSCSGTETADILGTMNKVQTGGAAAIGVTAVTANCPATAAPWSLVESLVTMPLSAGAKLEQTYNVTWGDGHQLILTSGELLGPLQ